LSNSRTNNPCTEGDALVATVKEVVQNVITEHPNAAVNNAELTIRAWLQDPEHLLPVETRQHLLALLPYATQGRLRSPESWRQERLKQTN
jgi:hypothetical protein